MAIGGALRAAMKAGNWAKTAMESRRRAAALADLNARGGITQSGLSPANYLRRQGVEPGPSVPMGGIAESPFGGRRIVMDPGGGRSTAPSFVGPSTRSRPMGSPIEAPYEGFRVLPGRVDRMGDTFSPPGPWQGRGRGTEWLELPIDGGPPYSSGSYFEPFRGNNILFPERLNSFEWTRFGQYPRPTPASRNFNVESPRYFFDDIAGTSGFTDPYTGFRYNMRGFPLD